MTAEEIEILVEANVEKALKEFEKLLPTVKKQLSGIQKEFEKVNIKDITANIDMSQVTKKVKQAKKQIKEIFDPNDISGITINGEKYIKKQLSGFSKQMQKFTGNNDLQLLKNKMDKVREELANFEVKKSANMKKFDPNDISNMKINGLKFSIQQIKGYSKEIQKLKGETGTLNRFKPQIPQQEIPKISKAQIPKLQTTKTESTGQANQYGLWANILRKYNAMLDMAKVKMYQLRQETEQTGTSQNRLTSFFGAFKGSLTQINSIVQSVKNTLGKIPNVTKIITNNIKKMGTGIKSGLVHILKYARSIT